MSWKQAMSFEMRQSMKSTSARRPTSARRRAGRHEAEVFGEQPLYSRVIIVGELARAVVSSKLFKPGEVVDVRQDAGDRRLVQDELQSGLADRAALFEPLEPLQLL